MIGRSINIINIGIMYIVLYIIVIKNNNNIEIDYRIIGGSYIIDDMNITLIILTTIITPIIYIMKLKEEERRKVEIIQIVIIIILLTNNLFYFFIFYELLLIPMYIYLIGYGSKYMKIEAAYRLIIYTIIGSLLLLISIIIIYISYGSLNMEYLKLINSNNKYLWFLMIISFIIKFPIFPFHIWLPIVHVESPTIGSVILAALILKIAYYGIIRYILPLFNDINQYYKSYIFILSIISILYGAIINIKEIDMKKIIAYSSIIHMNYAVFGLFSKEISSLISSYILMLSHGFISASLFLLIGLLYSRYHKRLYIYYRGLFIIMPLFSILFIFIILSNISIPFTSSFIPEILILINVLSLNKIIGLFFVLSLFFSSIYNIWLLIRIIYGSLSPNITLSQDLTLNEFLIFLPFIVFILLFSFFFTTISSILYPSFLLLL
jgi:NADH-quinone oxidoreductase subunit M